MPDIPFALAIATGLVAAVNPCGFALLPGYLSLLVIDDEAHRAGGRLAPVGRALVLTAAMTVGFVAVFGAFGLLAGSVADAVAQRLPWVGIGFGLLLVVLGGWLLAGRQLPSFAPRLARGPAVSRRFGSMVLFGAAYAVASLGCTIGPFLATVGAAAGAGSQLRAVVLFLAYAAGMALVVGTVALAVALANMSFVRGLRRAAPVIARASGPLLVLAGAYVAWYGWFELRAYAGAAGPDPIVDAAGRVQAAISSWLGGLGAVAVAWIFAGALVTALVLGLRRLARRG